MNLKLRHQRLRDILVQQDLDCLVLYSTRADSRYSLWFSGVPCRSERHYLIVDRDCARFIEVQYRAQELKEKSALPVLEVPEVDAYPEALAKELIGVRRFGVVGLVPIVDMRMVNAQSIDCTSEVDSLLAIKSTEEISRLSHLAGDALRVVEREVVRLADLPSVSEKELYHQLVSALLVTVDCFAFPLSIVSGERLRNSTLGEPTDRVIKHREPVVIDFGVSRGGYIADQTRTFFWGEDNTSSDAQHYRQLCGALSQSYQACREGASIGDYIHALEMSLSREKLPSETLLREELGHSVGFALHESPFIGISRFDSTILKNNMVLCIEPEVVVSGMRIRHEEMVVVTDQGAQPLI